MHKVMRIGNWLAPPHFVAFCVAMVAGVVAATFVLHAFDLSLMAGFNFAAILFLLLVSRLLATRDAATMRAHARDNDANRGFLLMITILVMIVLFGAIASEAVGRDPEPLTKVLIILTLIISWLFSNVVYALHYAHLAYGDDKSGIRGLKFEGTDEPVYEDFLYFAFTIGMTFQTSDVAITDRHLRRIVTLHSIAAFVFNLGVLAFTINVLGDGT